LRKQLGTQSQDKEKLHIIFSDKMLINICQEPMIGMIKQMEIGENQSEIAYSLLLVTTLMARDGLV
jgi:hypothetical protein